MPRLQIASVRCIEPREFYRDEIYFIAVYRWGYGPGDEDVTDAFVDTFRAESRSSRRLKAGDTVELNEPIIRNWSGAPSGIMNGVLALVEEDAREDFNASSWGVRVRRVKRLERYIDNQIDAAGGRVSLRELQRFLEDGFREKRLNDDLIGCCPLAPGTHDIRGAGGHYQITLEIV